MTGVDTSLRRCQLLGLCYARLISCLHVWLRVCYKESRVGEGRAVCLFCDGGEVRGWVSWSDGRGCWESLCWQSMTDGEGWPYMNSVPRGYPEHKNGVFVHLCVCCAQRGRGGTRFPQRRIDCRGCGADGWRGEVEEGWGCTLIPHTDLWPQHQPTCLEFHYRRRKTDGGRGASGGFWGLPPQSYSIMKEDNSVARKHKAGTTSGVFHWGGCIQTTSSCLPKQNYLI